MSKQYKTYKDSLGAELIAVFDNDTIGWCSNDNAEYLAWLAEGNEPEEWSAE